MVFSIYECHTVVFSLAKFICAQRKPSTSSISSQSDHGFHGILYIRTYPVATYWNDLNEAIAMSTHKMCFDARLTKYYLLNIHFIQIYDYMPDPLLKSP